MTVTDVRWRLNVMMFLMYFSIGSWAVTLASYLMASGLEGGLAFNASETSWIYSTFAVAGMLAPFLVGPLADRYFRGELVLGFAGVASAMILVAAAIFCDANQNDARLAELTLTNSASRAEVAASVAVRLAAQSKVLPLFVLMLLYCFFMQLSTTLTNAITMRNHPLGSDGYSRTRMWGTIGWIASGNIVGLMMNPISTQPFYLAAGSAFLLALLTPLLPKTPPLNKERKFLPALRLFRDRSFCVFILACFLATAFNQFYGVYAHRTFSDLGLKKVEQLMTVGQILEVFCMFAIPLLRPKDRLKTLLLVAVAGYILRAAVMVWGSTSLMVALAMPLHGWSFAFFFTTAQTFLRRHAGDDLAAGAQGVLAFMTGGIGALAGNAAASLSVNFYTVGAEVDWRSVWVVPLLGTSVLFTIMLFGFHPSGEKDQAKG